MRNSKNRYPNNWFEANRVVKNLEIQIIEAAKMPRGREKDRKLLEIMKASYTILKNLDEVIASSNEKEQKRLIKAREVLSTWMKKRRIPEKL